MKDRSIETNYRFRFEMLKDLPFQQKKKPLNLENI